MTLVSILHKTHAYCVVITQTDSVGSSKVQTLIKDDFQEDHLVSLNWMLFVSG